ncbi:MULTISPECIES: hypothetical protein [Acetobacteraceae]|uniref:Uncharacterized protein n=1 Tax=Komagataeibacter europaeus NBRC 3261 TaxID=1234669 RepID=A0A0D6PZD0_KOMEU|nr:MULTISPECIES: hypothetical protein [Acetobacteraceae]GAN96682.1 hypothetical protein Geu3261_0090_028 [Komagataeibacter europaeus NBRC 3261]
MTDKSPGISSVTLARISDATTQIDRARQDLAAARVQAINDLQDEIERMRQVDGCPPTIAVILYGRIRYIEVSGDASFATENVCIKTRRPPADEAEP